MRKKTITLVLLLMVSICYIAYSNLKAETYKIEIDEDLKTRFDTSSLKGELSFEMFQYALKGYNHFGFSSKKIVIIDFNKASSKKRFYIVNLDSFTIAYKTLVAHGKNTGANFATSFSNTEGSLQSSLGFYKTAETYNGKHGYSLRLDGLEKGINNNARKRAIIIHGADYVSQAFINKNRRLGRSFGCPALEQNISKEIINLIKDGTCLFIYKDEETYRSNSSIFK